MEENLVAFATAYKRAVTARGLCAPVLGNYTPPGPWLDSGRSAVAVLLHGCRWAALFVSLEKRKCTKIGLFSCKP